MKRSRSGLECGFSGFFQSDASKKSKPDELVQDFIRVIVACVRQVSSGAPKIKQSPGKKKHPRANEFTTYLGNKSNIYFAVQSCKTKEALFYWITEIFGPVWHSTMDSMPQGMLTRKLQTSVRNAIIDECKESDLFDNQECEHITDALTRKLVRTDTVPLKSSSSGSGTLPLSL